MTLIETMAKAAYDKHPLMRITIEVSHSVVGWAPILWCDLCDDDRSRVIEAQRLALSAARGIASANLVLKVGRQTGMRPSEVDLAVTHWIDAALEEK